jgi:hypothetical protein
LDTLLPAVRGLVQPTHDAISTLQEMQESIGPHCDEVCTEITAGMDLLIAALQERKGHLLAECLAMAADKAKTVATQRDGLLATLQDMTGACTKAERALNQGAEDLLDAQKKGNSLFATAQMIAGRAQTLDDLNTMLLEVPLMLKPRESSKIEFVADFGCLAEQISRCGDVAGLAAQTTHCTCEGDGLEYAYAGKETTFTVRAADIRGNACLVGGEDVSFVVEMPVHPPPESDPADCPTVLSPALTTLSQRKAAPGAVLDVGNGSYTCVYTPADEGAVLLHVRLRGRALPGSPFAVSVLPGKRTGSVPDLLLDPERKGSLIELTGSHGVTSTGYQTVLATETFEAGVHYWEARIVKQKNSGKSIGNVLMGIAKPECEVETALYGGDASTKYCIYDAVSYGNVGGVPLAFHPPLAELWCAGDSIGFLLDLERQELTLFRNKVFKGKSAIGPGPYKAAFGVFDGLSEIAMVHNAAWPDEPSDTDSEEEEDQEGLPLAMTVKAQVPAPETADTDGVKPASAAASGRASPSGRRSAPHVAAVRVSSVDGATRIRRATSPLRAALPLGTHAR